MQKRIKTVAFVGFIFFLLVLANYFINLHILKSAINDLQVHSINNASEHIVKWIEEKITALNSIEKLISQKNHTNDEDILEYILKDGSYVANFAYMFIEYEDNIAISSKKWINENTYNTTINFLYKNTTKNKNLTIFEPYISSSLSNTLVVSICMPTKDRKDKKGVLCGVLPLENIKHEILSISLPYNGSAFLVDKNKKILVHKDDKNLFKFFKKKSKLKNQLKALAINYEDYIFSQGHIKHTNWYLISQLDKDKVYAKVNLQLKINLLIYVVSLFLFIWLNIFYNRYQKLSDEKLKVSKSLLKSFIASDERGFLIADSKHNISFKNKKFIELLGINTNSLKKINLNSCKTIFTLLPLWVNLCLEEIIKKTKKKKQTNTKTFSFFKEEKKVFLFFTFIPVKSTLGDYNGIIITVSDITKEALEKEEKKEQEDILFQQTKMAALGEMIGAISHQWKQPLSALSLLLGNLLQFKQMNCLDDKVFTQNINYALSNTKYLSNTIDTFRDFYLPIKKSQDFNLTKAINHTIFILEPYFKNSKIKIDIKTLDDKYSCHNFKNEFQQIIASLLLNARDALLENKFNNMMYIEIEIINKINKYEIQVKDNGLGISLSIKDCLFTPFKSTKKQKGGSGNGLYLSKLIAKKKLLGDLKLVSSFSPTIFSLTMQKELKDIL